MNNATPRTLRDRVVIVTGASRGIGREIAVRAAADGANVALLAKTATPHPKIAGTLTETAQAVRAAGGQALPLVCDVRDGTSVQNAVTEVAATFGAIDVVINNAGALDLRRTPQLPLKNFERLLATNVIGPFAVVQAAYEHLRHSDAAHILNISPPVNLAPSWVGAHAGHTVGKYAESLLTLGWAAEFAAIPIAVNSLWPATTVASTGMLAAMGEEVVNAQARTPQIMADAAHAIVTRPATCSGHFYTDEQVLAEEGVVDLSDYRLAARDEDLAPNFYLSSTLLPTV
ncbi:SDR family NAD(P)-dependent oxidoreductase [Mycolicibacterium sp. CH28]|uniref:SDR family oxidoreductase n=1 Tax=Mycolicibacterium sp. CH28 TaxID=2512237 RepID=UPI001081D824|nr:SDR family oxidoreductase [Mycolicibacterium sp. CH28]TGD87070.1 SDR family NAD(P)-dependent oxidoreductase [Mycolicibacterium sp. CH28]